MCRWLAASPARTAAPLPPGRSSSTTVTSGCPSYFRTRSRVPSVDRLSTIDDLLVEARQRLVENGVERLLERRLLVEHRHHDRQGRSSRRRHAARRDDEAGRRQRHLRSPAHGSRHERRRAAHGTGQQRRRRRRRAAVHVLQRVLSAISSTTRPARSRCAGRPTGWSACRSRRGSSAATRSIDSAAAARTSCRATA